MSKKQVPVVEKGKLESGIKVGSKNWQKELQSLDSFRYIPNSDNAPFTVRREKGKGNVDYWYGYRKVSGKLHKRYIGKASDLNTELLEKIAVQLNIPPQPRKKKKVTDNSYVTSDEVKRLQQRVEELEAQLESKNKELAEASKKVESLAVELSTARDESDKLHIKLHNKPDYQKVLSRFITTVKIKEREVVLKNIKKYIKEIES